MGREIRRVPPNWEHPLDEHDFRPMYDEDFETAARTWLDECIAWENGSHVDLVRDPSLKIEFPFFWQWSGDPPDPKYYRPKWADATWYQVYETVSEGTPVTPPFATKEELVNYLVEHGDFWDQKRGHGGWERQAAERFVKKEWAPSMVVVKKPGETTIKMPRDGI